MSKNNPTRRRHVFRMMLVIFILAAFSGCATMQKTQTETRNQTRIVELEKELENRDVEIKELKGEVQKLSPAVEPKMSSSAKSADHQVSASIPVAASGEISSQSQEVSAYLNSDVIRVSAEAKDVQKALKNAGYYDGAIDGKVGKNTVQAIRQFQEEHALKVDGIIGNQTWTQLQTFLN